VAFQSLSSSLVPGDDNEARDVFVRDLLTGTTTRVSVDTEGDDANEASCCPGISADGRYVSFTSWADDLVPGSKEHFRPDVFVARWR
jgi:Tol biopolymer transport system component